MSENKLLKIVPFDTLFFRSGKPFDKGENSWTSSMLLPYPSVVWGSIFAMIWSKLDMPWKEANKNRHILKLKNIYLYAGDSCSFYLPAPYDLFKVDKEIVSFYYKNNKDIIASHPINYLIYPDTQKPGAKHLKDYFISVRSIRDYFRKQMTYVSLAPISDFLQPFSKVGIARDINTRTAKEAHLYNIDMVELKKEVAFVAEIEVPQTAKIKINGTEQEINIEEKLNGIDETITLGGEGKLARITDLGIKVPLEKEIGTNQPDFVKILFTSPAVLSADFDTLKKGGMIAASIGKPMMMGGWNIRAKRPKPLLKAIPPGSLMLWKGDEWNETKFKSYFIEKYDYDTIKLSETGFNQFVIYKYKT